LAKKFQIGPSAMFLYCLKRSGHRSSYIWHDMWPTTKYCEDHSQTAYQT